MAKSPKPQVDEALIRKLAELLDETGLTEIEFGTGDSRIRVAKSSHFRVDSNDARQPVAAAAAPEPTAEPADADHPGTVTSPMVGVVYTSSDPDTPAFVKVGDEVSEGQTLLLIEAMKVFNPITAPAAGKVTKILVGNGSPVEFGEPLVIIE
jgi:acetyl-CoA carboxylase biotin carboxyl carrier protein